MVDLTQSRKEYIQYILQTLGYYMGAIDGIFGPLTKTAIEKFQEGEKLDITGEIDPETLNALDKYIKGYQLYTIEEGDTLFQIATENNSNTQAILTANPEINPFLLEIGSTIIVPYNYKIVPTNVSYTYNILTDNLEALQARYPFIKVDIIGTSVDNRNIYRVRIGEGEKKVGYNASHHANEWITSPLLMSWLENFLEVYIYQGAIRGYNTEDIWNNTTIEIVPMVNPDGVELVINGREQISVNQEALYEWNNYSEDFSGWKANINGVDLNRNYDAGFEAFKELEEEFGVTGPAPALYAGNAPGSEPETKAMIQVTQAGNYRLVLAYHTQGQVIFWNYLNLQPEEAYTIAKAFSDVSGYTLASPALSQSYGGYKDWFIKAFRKPGYTIEVGSGVNPLSIQQFPMIYENNEELLLLAAVI